MHWFKYLKILRLPFRGLDLSPQAFKLGGLTAANLAERSAMFVIGYFVPYFQLQHHYYTSFCPLNHFLIFFFWKFANMAGTVIITGATGSLALEAVQQLLSSHPSLTIVGTVRNAKKSPRSPQLLRLEELAHRYPSSKLLIKSVDLNSTLEVRAFSDEIAGLVESNELPPIHAIICNAFTWSLDGQQFSKDRLESTFQVNHLSHYLLVLKFLRSMDPETGRVVMLSSEVHDPEHFNPLSKLGADLPSSDSLDTLVNPGADEVGTEHDMGWQRYANSKLANVMFMQSMNKRLQQV